MRSVYALPHDILGFEILQLSVGILGGLGVAGAARAIIGGGGDGDLGLVGGVGLPQRLIPASRRAGCQRYVAEGSPLVLGSHGRGILEVVALAAVADDVLVLVLVGVVVVLALAARGAKEALLALATATHARRVMGVVDAAEIAADLATPAGDACLVDALVLWLSRAGAVRPRVVVVVATAAAVGVVLVVAVFRTRAAWVEGGGTGTGTSTGANISTGAYGGGGSSGSSRRRGRATRKGRRCDGGILVIGRGGGGGDRGRGRGRRGHRLMVLVLMVVLVLVLVLMLMLELVVGMVVVMGRGRSHGGREGDLLRYGPPRLHRLHRLHHLHHLHRLHGLRLHRGD